SSDHGLLTCSVNCRGGAGHVTICMTGTGCDSVERNIGAPQTTSGDHETSVGFLTAGLRSAVGDQREQHCEHHEHDRCAEHPVRQVLVHDPAVEQGADDAADV